METTENKTIKDLVQEIKFKKRITQKEIAAEIGVANTYLSDVINNKVPYTESVRGKLLEKYSEYLGSDSTVQNYGSNNQSAIGNNIRQSNEAILTERFIDLLEKKDEQIDRLISIIEKQNQ